MWAFFARGPRADLQRHSISDAIAPIWEANHVWLILVVVLLFTGFPRAFAAMMVALHIPIALMLVGIVLRGSTFVFRKYDTRGEIFRRRWNLIFGLASFFTPFLQGMILGALTTGQIRVSPSGEALTGFFAGWLTPFAFACGFFALALFAFLAALYMTHETRGDADLQNDFRRRALWAELALAPLAFIVFFASKSGAPAMYAGLTNWWAPVLLGWTALAAATATVALWLRKFELARIAGIAQVAFILIGWGIAQFPKPDRARRDGLQFRRAGNHAAIARAGPRRGSNYSAAVARVFVPHFQGQKSHALNRRAPSAQIILHRRTMWYHPAADLI